MGLAIYLDNKKTNISAKETVKILLSGIYKRPYWIIEFQTTGDQNYMKNGEYISANLTEMGDCGMEPRYHTRSMDKIKNQLKKTKKKLKFRKNL